MAGVTVLAAVAVALGLDDTRTGTAPQRRRDRTGQRLTRIQHELGELAAERRVLAQQVTYLRGVADDASTQAVVRPTRSDRREAEAAVRDLTTHERLLRELDERRTGLERERDALLDAMLD